MIENLFNLFAPHFRSLAYLDPGSGSIIVQVLIAGLMTVGIVLKVFWKKIKGLFKRSAEIDQDDLTKQP
ncbi:MAG: hypothetical protein C3F13_09005 [Anaerolineales bacterium]|nr:hypothetical protein [Anaerolineae bacterium]PWB53622.1 MAG: hypothetical protein C3F13_09005 [Anaerolineales bacterium]